MCPTCLERYPLDFRVCPRDASELQEIVEEEADLGALGGRAAFVRIPLGERGRRLGCGPPLVYEPAVDDGWAKSANRVDFRRR